MTSSEPKKIDAHQHFWRVDRGDYHWMPPAGLSAGPLREDHLPNRLLPHLRHNDVVGTILVQAAQTINETLFLLDIARSTDYVLGVTGWVELDRDDAIEQVAQLEAIGPLLAIRPMLHDLDDDRWITWAVVRKNLARLEAHGQRLEVLSYSRHLAPTYEALADTPDLPVVIDHLSKPRYSHDADAEWREWMSRFASRPNTFCKLSGIVTEIGPDWTIDQIEPVVRFVVESFGADRVMFGSDWPVCRKVAEYDEIVDLVERLLARVAPSGAPDIWFNTAVRFYGLETIDATGSEERA